MSRRRINPTQQDVMRALRRQPQRLRDLADGSANWQKRQPIRALLDEMEAAGLVRRVRLVGAPHYVLSTWVAGGKWLRDHLLGNTVATDGGCMRWVGALDGGQITARVDGRKLNVRTELWRLYGKVPLPPGYCLRASCGDPRCLAPAHLEPQASAAATRGRPRAVHVRAKIAAGKRARSSTTVQVVEQIRGATGSEREIGRRFGVHPSMVGRIRRGENWLSYDGPLGQLARAA